LVSLLKMAVNSAYIQPLISAIELARSLDNPQWTIIDCRFDLLNTEAGFRTYCSGHIPGAYYAHLEMDLSAPVTPSSGRHPLPQPANLSKNLQRWGVCSSSHVIVYDTHNGAFACRLWWLLKWLGHHSVSVLDGGMTAWTQANLPVTNELPNPRQTQYCARPDDTLWVSTQFIESKLATPDFRLVDVRTSERYTGCLEPIDTVAGHIPTAINIPFEHNVDGTGKFLPSAALKQIYEPVFCHVAPRDSAVMCGSGVTACQTLFALELAGFSGAKLYAGSWSEWIRNPKRPISSVSSAKLK
jgi:thiosulfate/3-mercaptopyruvate sulfurtransferase